jgi:putative FmdB family regulatory protein
MAGLNRPKSRRPKKMPIYEYECAKCGHIHEIMQKMSEKPLTKCPDCSGKLHKLISQSAFHLKGSGWYVTDYSNKSNSSTASAKKNETPKTCADAAKPAKDTGSADAF